MAANLYSAFDSTGLIVSVFELEDGTTPTTGDYPTGGGYVSGAYDPDLWYIVDPAGTPTPTERPTLGNAETYSILADNTDAVTISIPSGTVITDIETGSTQTAVSADTFQFKSNARTGKWFVQIDPPFPYQSATLEISADAYSN